MENQNNSEFSFYTQKELRDIKYIEKIEEVVRKHNILEDESELLDSVQRNSLHIIDYVSVLLHKKIEIQTDIKDLFVDNYPFIEELNIFLKKKLDNLTKNNSTYFFKDITTMFKLFSISSNHEIFISYNEYDFNELSSLFRFLENDLILNSKDKELFELKFESFVILLKSLTQLCVINSTDVQRKKSLKILLELMTESSNTLKFNLPLEESKLHILNHIQGTHLFYFLNLHIFTIDKNDLTKSVKNYFYSLERLEDGYLLSKNSNFGEIENKNDKESYKEFIIFKSNCSILILDFLTKLDLEEVTLNQVKEIDEFKKILKVYSEHFEYDFSINYEIEDINIFKNKLLDSLIYEYEINQDFTKLINHNTILNDFIFSDKKFKSINLKPIFSILLYAKDTENFKYLNIGQILVKSEKIKNDYHEFYKLEIFDLIINHFSKKKITYETKELFEDILTYVEKNKITSHLFSKYSKIYLSLSFYYSQDYSTINISKALYKLYVQTNGKELLETEYSTINKQILLNFAKYYAEELGIKNEIKGNEDKLINLSKTMIKKISDYDHLEIQVDFNTKLSNLSNKIIENSLIEFDDIEDELEELIQNTLFKGICSVNIVGISNKSDELKDAGYKRYLISIDNNSALNFTFPIILENTFLNILKVNKEFLITNINNLLNSLKQNNKHLFDSVTGLYNIKKLNNSIKNSPEIKIGFIEILIKSLITFNEKYGFEKGNTIFKLIAKKIKLLCNNEEEVFKLNGARIGILLSNPKNKENLIEEIENLSIEFEGNRLEINPYVVHTIDRKDRILFSSSKNIDRALFDKRII